MFNIILIFEIIKFLYFLLIYCILLHILNILLF